MPWRLSFTRRAERDLARMPAQDRQAIREALERTAVDPSRTDLKKLGGHEDEWRLRVGRWRVRIVLDNRAGMISVARVLPRKDAYRD